MGHPDWDRGLRALVNAEKRIRTDSRIAREDQEHINELLDALHNGEVSGGVFIRTRGGTVRYIFIGGSDPAAEGLDAIIEIIKAHAKRR